MIKLLVFCVVYFVGLVYVLFFVPPGIKILINVAPYQLYVYGSAIAFLAIMGIIYFVKLVKRSDADSKMFPNQKTGNNRN